VITCFEDDDRLVLQSLIQNSVHPLHQVFPKIGDLKEQFQEVVLHSHTYHQQLSSKEITI
jgi:hypothetical protein